MDNNFSLIWSFRNRFNVLKESILSANKTCNKNVDFVLIDAASDENTIKSLRTFCNTITDRTIRICETTYRTNLSEAWNLGMMLTNNRYIIFSSSDTVFLKEGWVNAFKLQISANYEYILMENHAVFCIDKKCIPKLGWFDENFVPGPHFDVDYMIRASESNIKFIVIPNTFYTHGDTEEIMRERRVREVTDRLPMHDFTNDYIFKNKWQSDWKGWEVISKLGRGDALPHPPTHITQVKRMYSETDAHPFYTKKYK